MSWVRCADEQGNNFVVNLDHCTKIEIGTRSLKFSMLGGEILTVQRASCSMIDRPDTAARCTLEPDLTQWKS